MYLLDISFKRSEDINSYQCVLAQVDNFLKIQIYRVFLSAAKFQKRIAFHYFLDRNFQTLQLSCTFVFYTLRLIFLSQSSISITFQCHSLRTNITFTRCRRAYHDWLYKSSMKAVPQNLLKFASRYFLSCLAEIRQLEDGITIAKMVLQNRSLTRLLFLVIFAMFYMLCYRSAKAFGNLS